MESSPSAQPAGSSTWQFVLRYQGRRILVGLVGLLFLSLIAAVLYSFITPVLRIPPAKALALFFVLGSAIFIVQRLVDRAMDRYERQERQAEQGAVAEESVGAILDRLPKDQHVVLHDVKTRRGNIDHLVFRRDGAIFIIETKSHHGTITECSGELRRDGHSFEKNIVQQTLFEIYDLRDILAPHFSKTPWSTAAIVFTNGRVPLAITVSKISVINIQNLEGWIGKTLGDATISAELWPQMDAIRKRFHIPPPH